MVLSVHGRHRVPVEERVVRDRVRIAPGVSIKGTVYVIIAAREGASTRCSNNYVYCPLNMRGIMALRDPTLLHVRECELHSPKNVPPGVMMRLSVRGT